MPTPSKLPVSLITRLRGARVSPTRRILVTGLLSAGLYAALLGPAGALAQDPTPEPSSDAAPEPTQTAEPTQTPEPSPEPTQSEPSPEPTQTAEATPEATASPDATAAPSPEPTPTAAPDPAATPVAEAAPGEKPIDWEKAADVEDFVVDLEEDEIRDILCPPSERVQKKNKKGRKNKDRDARGKDSTSTRDLECLDEVERARRHRSKSAPRIRNADGTPTLDNPTFALAMPGAAPIGVPNFIIDKFRIPPFLLPIYQAAGMQYGVRWELLAAINEIETDYGRNLNVSSAGALGWMQFMPATWKAYGVDANKDGVRDPYNPVDAIFAAARYLRAAGAETDIRKAVFAYNHADWYVDSVLLRARMIGGLPSNFVGSLTGLTQARFPVYAKSRYADDLDEREATKKVSEGQNAAYTVEGDESRRGIKIFARRGAPVVAVNDGRVVNIGESARLGRFIQLQDVYGNVFTYANLGSVAKTYPAPRPRTVSRDQVARELDLPRKDAAPTAAASATTKKAKRSRGGEAFMSPHSRDEVLRPVAPKERLFANPARPGARAAGGEVQLAEAKYDPSAAAPLKLNRRDYRARALKEGSRVIAGTILGRIGKVDLAVAPHVLFEIRPAGRGAPRIDPKPILDGWKLLESTAIYRASGKNPFFGRDAKTLSIGQILLMGKEALIQRVLANPRIEIYSCGRTDVRLGAVDRRVLATLEFLAASGLKPTVTSLRCGHGYYTKGGSVSHHSSGNAVDIAAINGIPMLGHQGKGSITELAVQRLLTLQGTLKPAQIITLMTFEGADNTYAMGDHHDHIHVGWQPMYGTNSRAAKRVNAELKPDQWIKLIDRLREIDNPTVRRSPSKYALKARKRPASHAHHGE